MITFSPIKRSWVRVLDDSDLVGEIMQSDSTTFTFYPRPSQGFTASDLFDIAAELHRLNTAPPCPS